MQEDVLKSYEVEPVSLWGASYLLDSDDLADRALRRGWEAIGIWGKDGYDLGNWPLVVIYFKDQTVKSLYSLVYYVEGDIVQYDTPTEAIRNAICDHLAHWHWRAAERDWVKDYPTVESLPADLRGPYRED